MIDQVKYTYSWIDVKLNQRLGQRGAEMVEYAVVLACVAIVAVWFYSTDAPNNSGNSDSKQKTMTKILERIWNFIKDKISAIK